MRKFLAAAVQLTSTDDVGRNLDRTEALVREAAGRGAALIVLPENFAFLGAEGEKAKVAEPLDGPSLTRLASLARELGVHLCAGGFHERAPVPGKVHNTAVLFGPAGERLAVYRKIHLFDVDLPGGQRFRESDHVVPGVEPVVAETALCRIGLSICYDLRFPELYRALSAQGAEVILVPSAFTLYTGKDHWHPLLRARAIENQCYLLAAAQFGQHGEKRWTYGKSLLADPWGGVVAQAADGEGLAVGEVDLELVARVRRDLPALAHRRL
jgi:predicted amidohydrolase